MKTIAWESPARQEFEGALAVSRDLAEFQRVVEEALQDIASGRVTHAQVPRTPSRQCVLTTPLYSIIHTETDDEIRVWALPHHKWKPGYWKRRLSKN